MKLVGRCVGLTCGKTNGSYFGEGKRVFNFSVAVYDPFDKENVFWPCVAFGKLAELIESRYQDKVEVVFDYALKKEKWEAKDGTKREMVKLVVTEMDMIGWRIRKKLGEFADEPKQEPFTDNQGEVDDEDPPF